MQNNDLLIKTSGLRKAFNQKVAEFNEAFDAIDREFAALILKIEECQEEPQEKE
jgi:hypothetical protein